MLNQGYHNSGKPITVVPEFKKYFNKTNTKATRLDKIITIKKKQRRWTDTLREILHSGQMDRGSFGS